MGTGMGTRLYPLPDGDEDGIKLWYPLGLGMGMWWIFFYGDEYGIAKHVPPRSVAIPSYYPPIDIPTYNVNFFYS